MMKNKRLLSLVLAVLMAVTSISAGFTAFAADSPDYDYDFSQEVSEFRTIPINRPAIGGNVIQTKEGVQKTLDNTWNLIKIVMGVSGVKVDLSNGLNGVFNQYIYIAENVTKVFQIYANLSHDADYGEYFYSLFNTQVIADYLVQDDNKFAGAIEKIQAITVSEEEAAEGINDLDKLLEIEFTDKDFGFLNGNQQGFIDAMLAVSRPMTYFISDDCDYFAEELEVNFSMFDSVDDDGKAVFGIYSIIIPVLEQMGLLDLPTAEEYKSNYYAVKSSRGANVAYDELLRVMVESAFRNIVQPIADKPFNGLLAVLPRAAYVLDSGLFNETAKAIVCSLGEEFVPFAESLNFTSERVNEILMSFEMDLTEETGEECYFRFKPVNFDVLADCATVSVVPSHSNVNKNVLIRTVDVDSCFVNVFYYLYDLMFTDKGNYRTLKMYMKAAFEEDTYEGFVKQMDEMASLGRYAACGEYLERFGDTGRTKIKPVTSDAQNKFTDLAPYVIYDDYVAYTSVYNSFITGTNPPVNNVFTPNAAITRAMLITIIYRMEGSPYDNGNNPYSGNPFTDVPSDSYYYNAACWALKNGITTEKLFKPHNNVTREQTAAFFYRYADMHGKVNGKSYTLIQLTDYPDGASVSSWAVLPMKWANCNGMISGTQQGYLNPQGATLRIHASKILYGFGNACRIGNFK